MKIKHLAATTALTVVGVAAALLPFLATSANASTGGCTGGTYAGYCGTQTNPGATGLSFDVTRQSAKVGVKIIGYPNSDTDKATDFFTFGYGPSPTEKIFEYAPNGVASGLCISEPASAAGLELRTCNGSAFQRFVARGFQASPASPWYYSWANKETGDLVASNGLRGQLTGVLAPSGTPPNNELWVFNG